MVKSKAIKLKVETKDFGNQKIIQLCVDAVDTKELVLLLLLLREGLVDLLEIIFDNFKIYLKSTEENVSKCSLIEKNIFKGSISTNSLEYLIFFLLKYYRDQIGEADHVDIDFRCLQGTEVTLVIKTELYKEYSKEDIKKFLDL